MASCHRLLQRSVLLMTLHNNYQLKGDMLRIFLHKCIPLLLLVNSSNKVSESIFYLEKVNMHKGTKRVFNISYVISIDHPASAPTQSNEQYAKVFIPYYPHVNKQINSIFHHHSVSSACTSNKNLRDLLSSTKSRQPALQTSNVIYQIPCKDCSATYCGQTSRPLHKRISEHKRYTRIAFSHATNLQQSSALAQHVHASGHQIDFSSAVILAKLQHQQQLDLVGHAAITVLEPSLNRNHAAPSINPQ